MRPTSAAGRWPPPAPSCQSLHAVHARLRRGAPPQPPDRGGRLCNRPPPLAAPSGSWQRPCWRPPPWRRSLGGCSARAAPPGSPAEAESLSPMVSLTAGEAGGVVLPRRHAALGPASPSRANIAGSGHQPPPPAVSLAAAAKATAAVTRPLHATVRHRRRSRRRRRQTKEEESRDHHHPHSCYHPATIHSRQPPPSPPPTCRRQSRPRTPTTAHPCCRQQPPPKSSCVEGNTYPPLTAATSRYRLSPKKMRR